VSQAWRAATHTAAGQAAKMVAPPAAATVEAEIEDLVASCYADPLKFVKIAYPWGEPGTALEHETGPDDNQREFLQSLGAEVKARKFDGRTPVMPTGLRMPSCELSTMYSCAMACRMRWSAGTATALAASSTRSRSA